MMRISIAMATYNGATYLQEQLDSFLAQTRQPDELVVCDDGSTDATLDILGRFRQRAPFAVQIRCNEANLGFTKNFEKVLRLCSGDLIFLSDQDDVWSAAKIDVMEKVFLSNPAKLLVVHDGKLVDEKLEWHGATKLSQVIAGFGTGNALVMGALTAIRREFLSWALPVPERIIGHDVWLHNIARHLDVRLVLDDHSLQFIRRHSSNTSNWIASSVKKIGRLDVLVSQLRTTAARGYEDRIFINESIVERLSLISGQDTIFLKDAIKRSLEYLASERCALARRNNILSAGTLKRKSMALQLLLQGDYRFFNGYKSFLRDVTK